MNIFVGNLGPYIHKEDLEEVFRAFGEVKSVKIVFDKHSGRSKGFGFVKMVNYQEALEAIHQLDQTELNGRDMAVFQANSSRKYWHWLILNE